MDFYEVLERVLELLQRHRRVSYRALKVQFALDDDHLDLLKEELLYAQYPIADDHGRGLVWTGAPGGVQEPAPPQSTQPLAVQEQPSQQVAPLPTAPPPDAERRQLTVMFCDLVDSTTLSGRLDPEEYRDVVRAYQATCTEVIRRYDGHIAQLLGDGLLVYFGYPRAHEDDAHRAVRTGLGILTAIEDPHTRLHQQAQGIQLAIRIGVHTGLVVIGDMGGQGRQEQLALGEVPNVCSRIEALAAPNTIAMSEATYR
ncbi:MAG TPA: adenylate/guanylate cyclase domain-containing protein, partial [Candidatus Tectomicrobia bacterium]